MNHYPIVKQNDLSDHSAVENVAHTQTLEGDLCCVSIEVSVCSSKKLVFHAETEIIDAKDTASMFEETGLVVSRQVEIFAADENHECFFHHPFQAANSNEVKSVTICEDDGVMKIELHREIYDLDFQVGYSIFVEPEFNQRLIAEGVTASNNKITYTMVFQRCKTR